MARHISKKTKAANIKDNIMERAASAFDLPADALAGLPHIEIIGLRKLLIENHKGIVEYGNSEIDVSGGNVLIKVKGEELELLAMTKNELLIGGTIMSVEFV